MIKFNNNNSFVHLYKNWLPDSIDVYNQLLDLEWGQEKIKVYGKWYTPNRYVYSMGNDGITYTYAGSKKETNNWNDEVNKIKQKINEEFDINYNYCLLNYYPDGTSKLGFHSDDEKDLVKDIPIFSISLGETRLFRI